MARRAAGPFDLSLADRVRFARHVAGMTQRELAAAIGTRVAQLRRYEAGTATISAATLLRIAVAVDAPVGWLYGVDDNDHWPDTLLASLVRNPQVPALVSAFARIADAESRRLALAMVEEMGSRPRPRPPAPSAPPVLASPAPKTRRKRALLVDDAPDMLLVIGAFLRSGGYDVVRANGAEAALDVLGGNEPLDVLVTDYAMPGMSGLELVRRAAGLRPRLPALVITAFAADLALTAGWLPGTVVLAKPFACVDLLNAVHTVCSRAEAGPPAG